MQQNKHVIRKYTPTDTERIIELFRLNTPFYFSPSEEKDLKYYLNSHSENYYLIEENNKILACGGFNLLEDGKVVRVSWDIVQPESHGKGMGTLLVDYRMEIIASLKGVKRIEVRTSQLVFKFYERFGFITKEIVPDFWAIGYDLYRMEYEGKNIPISNTG